MKIAKLAIIAGKGDLPLAVIKSCKEKNISFCIVGIYGQSQKSVINKYNHFWFKLGHFNKLFNYLKSQNVSHISFAGAVKRPSIFNIGFDSLTKSLIKKYLSYIKKVGSGDNSLLTFFIKVFEQDFGFKVVSPQSLNPNILAKPMLINKHIYEQYQEDISFGFKIAKKIGELDIGQSIIVQHNMVIAVEGVEGTDRLIKRSKKLLKKSGKQGILIKVKKPDQEERIDLPTIGLKTLKALKKSGLIGVLIEAESSLLLNQDKVSHFLKFNKMFLASIKNNSYDESL